MSYHSKTLASPDSLAQHTLARDISAAAWRVTSSGDQGDQWKSLVALGCRGVGALASKDCHPDVSDALAELSAAVATALEGGAL